MRGLRQFLRPSGQKIPSTADSIVKRGSAIDRDTEFMLAKVRCHVKHNGDVVNGVSPFLESRKNEGIHEGSASSSCLKEPTSMRSTFTCDSIILLHVLCMLCRILYISQIEEDRRNEPRPPGCLHFIKRPSPFLHMDNGRRFAKPGSAMIRATKRTQGCHPPTPRLQ